MSHCLKSICLLLLVLIFNLKMSTRKFSGSAADEKKEDEAIETTQHLNETNITILEVDIQIGEVQKKIDKVEIEIKEINEEIKNLE